MGEIAALTPFTCGHVSALGGLGAQARPLWCVKTELGSTLLRPNVFSCYPRARCPPCRGRFPALQDEDRAGRPKEDAMSSCSCLFGDRKSTRRNGFVFWDLESEAHVKKAAHLCSCYPGGRHEERCMQVGLGMPSEHWGLSFLASVFFF